MNYKKLIVWQKSLDLTILIYELTKTLPKNERFGLIDQMQRCAVSIPSNIAEGYSRISKKSFVNFLKISLGSISELETQIILSEKLKYIDKEKEIIILDKIIEIQKIIGALIRNNKNY
jgi:four helix bundle protein